MIRFWLWILTHCQRLNVYSSFIALNGHPLSQFFSKFIDFLTTLCIQITCLLVNIWYCSFVRMTNPIWVCVRVCGGGFGCQYVDVWKWMPLRWCDGNWFNIIANFSISCPHSELNVSLCRFVASPVIYQPDLKITPKQTHTQTHTRAPLIFVCCHTTFHLKNKLWCLCLAELFWW